MKKIIALVVMGLLVLSALALAQSGSRGDDDMPDDDDIDDRQEDRREDRRIDGDLDESGRDSDDIIDDRRGADDSLDDDALIVQGSIAGGITSSDAIARAQRLAPGNTERAELELEDSGRLVWKIRLNDNGARTDVRLDAATGELARIRFEDGREVRLDGSRSSGASDESMSVSSIDAIESATRQSGGDLEQVEFEAEDGKVVWKVRMNENGVRTDVRVDAQTGDVLEVKEREQVQEINLNGQQEQRTSIFRRILAFFGLA